MLPSPSAPTPLSLSRCSPPPSRYRNTFSSSSSTLSSTALPYYMHLLGRDTASRGHRCTDAHSHARVAHSRTFARSRALSTDCLRSLVEFNDLSDRTVSLYLAPVDPRGLPLALSLPLSLSLFFCTRALAPSIATSLAPLVTTDTSYLVLSLPASRPFLLSSSFPPFLPPIDSSCFCTLPPCRPFFATRSLLYRYSRSYFADLLSFSLSLFVSRTDGNAERNGPERQCGQRRCTHRTVQRWTLMD